MALGRWLLIGLLFAGGAAQVAGAQRLFAGVYGGTGSTGEGGVYLGGFDWWPHGGPQIELGVAGPFEASGAVLSADYVTRFSLQRRCKGACLVAVGNAGYTRFEGSNALNYGGGFMWPYRPKSGAYDGVRLEYRENRIGGTERVWSIRLSREWGWAR